MEKKKWAENNSFFLKWAENKLSFKNQPAEPINNCLIFISLAEKTRGNNQKNKIGDDENEK